MLFNIRSTARALINLMEKKIRTRDIMTMKAFENAITMVQALGGSTNACLHIMGMAVEADVPLEIWDFNRIADKTPYIGNLKPNGAYNVVDFDAVGGMPVAMKMMLEAGLLHGDVMTCTGKTLAENLKDTPLPAKDQDVIFPIEKPISPPGCHLIILKGNLSPGGAVIKLSGKQQKTFGGTARCSRTTQIVTKIQIVRTYSELGPVRAL